MNLCDLISSCHAVSDLPSERLKHLAALVQSCLEVDGDLLEVGVYRGGSAKLLCSLSPHKLVHLFDTFCGLPKPGHPRDQHRAGDWADTSVEWVQRTLGANENYRLYPGEFPGTLAGWHADALAFVHMDTDLHAPTVAAIEQLWPMLEPGGVMVFDDYGAPLCGGVKAAVDELLLPKVSPKEVMRCEVALAVRKT